MIIRDLFFESGSTEATKIKKKYEKHKPHKHRGDSDNPKR
jgi:hypothetical protein